MTFNLLEVKTSSCLLCNEPTNWSDGLCNICTTRMAQTMDCSIPDHIPIDQQRRFMKLKVKQLLEKEKSLG
jgi:hypothetical protein